MNIKQTFDQDGFVVLRGVIPQSYIRDWIESWADWNAAVLSKGRKVDPFNPVCIHETMPPVLQSMRKCPAILDVVEQVFGPDIALYNHRMLVKDKHARGPVFLHQDTGYHVGWPAKASAFVPLCKVGPDNGGLSFFTGSHQYGYLGDAGQISDAAINGVSGFLPVLEPGDFVLMHSACWHLSLSHRSGPDRVMADIIYQPSSDPSGIELMRGEWRCEPKAWMHHDIFHRSRVSRLKELQKQVDDLQHAK